MSKKQIQNILYWGLMASMVVYFLYSRGFIGVSFESITPKVAYERIQNDTNNSIVIVDVRTPTEFEHDGHIQEAILFPVDSLAQSLDKLQSVKNKTLLVYCRSGNRSLTAARTLQEAGFTVVNIEGGMVQWRQEGLPFE